jgi:hypothetical protein
MQRYAEAESPEQKFGAAFDAGRATARRLARKRTTFGHGPSRNSGSRLFEDAGKAAAGRLLADLAEMVTARCRQEWEADWERTWAAGHRGKGRRQGSA